MGFVNVTATISFCYALFVPFIEHQPCARIDAAAYETLKDCRPVIKVSKVPLQVLTDQSLWTLMSILGQV